jgi:integrative and conjugative element protein (TIGR02256 family)
MPELEFWAADRKFGLKIPEKEVSRALTMCTQSKPHETGGILIGFYTTAYDCAVVTAVSRAPSDSQHGRMHFIRGVRGLQRWVDYLWRRRHHYYLGEWHFHPEGSPYPSPTDVGQMRTIAKGTAYQCPEPILVIVGGRPPERWQVRAYVFPKGKGPIELMRSNASSGSRSGRQLSDDNGAKPPKTL